MLLLWGPDRVGLPAVQPQGADDQVEHAAPDHGQGADLAARGVGHRPHRGRDDRTAAHTHDHQPRNLVGLLREPLHGRRVDHREDARAEEPDGPDHRQHGRRTLRAGQGDQRRQRRGDVEAEILRVVHLHQQDRPHESTDRAADEIDARSVARRVDGEPGPLDQQLGRHGVDAHVDPHDEEDAEEEHADPRIAQQPHRGLHRRSFGGGRLLDDGRGEQPQSREQRHGGEDREEVLPVAQPVRCEGGDERAAERRDGLHDLARGV